MGLPPEILWDLSERRLWSGRKEKPRPTPTGEMESGRVARKRRVTLVLSAPSVLISVMWDEVTRRGREDRCRAGRTRDDSREAYREILVRRETGPHTHTHSAER